MNRLTVAQVAAELHRHPELVRRWLRDRRLKGERIGWNWFVTRRELDRFREKEPLRRRR